MSNSLHQYKTSRGALEREQGAGQTTLDAMRTYHSMTNGIPDSSAGHAALHSIAGGISAPLQFSAAIDIAQRQFGNRATLEFIHQQRAHHIARAGLSDAGQSYPFLTEIQRSFGKHDISGLAGHTGEAARAANSELGSTAYHKGGHVAFGREPTLADAAHEAAHYVQGVGARQLEGGMGLPGDEYEQHADRVVAAAVAGESAEPLLDRSPGGGGIPVVATSDAPVQMTGGLSGKTSGKAEPEEEEPKLKGLVPLDQSKAMQRIDDLAGPLPGPPGHTDFGIIQYTQPGTIRPEMDCVHIVVGVYRTSERGGYFTELTGNLALRNREDYPDVTAWVMASPIRVHRIKPDKTAKVPHSTIILPIDNLDEVYAYMQSTQTPETGEIAEAQLRWNLNSQDKQGKVTQDRVTCFHYVAEVASKMKVTGDDSVFTTSAFTFRETQDLFTDLAGRGYLRFRDAPDTTERVRILHESFVKQWEPSLQNRWSSEVPLRRLPDPETYNAEKGFVTKYHPRQSLMDKEVKIMEDPRNRHRLEGYAFNADDKKDDPKFAEFFPNQRKK